MPTETRLGRMMRRLEACARRYEDIAREQMVMGTLEVKLAIHVASQPQRVTAGLGDFETLDAYDIELPEDDGRADAVRREGPEQEAWAAGWVHEFESACRVSEEDAFVDEFKNDMMS
jgi:hypothetical protein